MIGKDVSCQKTFDFGPAALDDLRIVDQVTLNQFADRHKRCGRLGVQQPIGRNGAALAVYALGQLGVVPPRILQSFPRFSRLNHPGVGIGADRDFDLMQGVRFGGPKKPSTDRITHRPAASHQEPWAFRIGQFLTGFQFVKCEVCQVDMVAVLSDIDHGAESFAYQSVRLKKKSKRVALSDSLSLDTVDFPSISRCE